MILQAQIPVAGIYNPDTGFFHIKNYRLWQF